MENIKINPSLSTEAKHAQSGLSVMDFNINEICKRLTIFMNACQESKAVEKAVECSVISYSLDRQMMIDDVIQQIQELLSLTVLHGCRASLFFYAWLSGIVLYQRI